MFGRRFQGIKRKVSYDSYTKLLMPFDSDYSDIATSKVFNNAGGVSISTSSPKFGAGSALFSGASNSYLYSTSNYVDYAFIANDFTIDCWFKHSGTGVASETIIYTYGSYGSGIKIVVKDTTVECYARGEYNDFASVISPVATPRDGEWHHIALVRYYRYFTLYLDGVGGTPVTDKTTLVILQPTREVMIGCQSPGTNQFYGYLDELRVSRGKARWTSNFTPPTAPY